MKKFFNSVLLSAALVLPALAQAGYIQQVTLNPAQPDIHTPIAVAIEGFLPTPLYGLASPATVNVMGGSHVFIDLFAQNLNEGMMGIMVLYPFADHVPLGYFEAGQYMLHTRMNINGTLRDEHISYFDVMAHGGTVHPHPPAEVPVPATALLLLGGLMSLLYLRRR